MLQQFLHLLYRMNPEMIIYVRLLHVAISTFRDIWGWVQIMELLIVHLPPFSYYIIPLGSKYSPWNPVLKHPQSMTCETPYKITRRMRSYIRFSKMYLKPLSLCNPHFHCFRAFLYSLLIFRACGKYVYHVLSLNNSFFFLFTGFKWLSQLTPINSPNNINQLLNFVVHMRCFLCGTLWIIKYYLDELGLICL
jgi:hypothetical protein